MEFRVEIGEISRDRERDNTDISDSDTDTADTLRGGGSICSWRAEHFKVSAPSSLQAG